ncbi:MAG: FprA family A-type flavoprotein, partial [Planctomycetota bacterium]
MKALEIKPDVYWVGAIDWDLRNFHGYKTQRGATYNAYLILDEKVTLVDTVKHYLFDEMLARIRDVIEPERIDVLLSNHVEMDHSGGLPAMVDLAPHATVVTSQIGEAGLRAHFKADWNFHPVQSGDRLSIGRRTLHFVTAPMVHWPDSMVTYVPEDALLLSNDGFGQHIASTERFAAELGFDVVMEEAAKYYANIVLPYGPQVQKLLAALADAEVEMIATAHGLCWRDHIGDIVGAYKRWAANQTVPKAVLIYDTMWGSTRKLAYALREGVESEGVPVTMGNLASTDISDIMTHLLEARGVLVGSPTLNSRMVPTVAGALNYVGGLRPRNRLGLAFGSYGWGRQGVSEVAAAIEEMGWEMP